MNAQDVPYSNTIFLLSGYNLQVGLIFSDALRSVPASCKSDGGSAILREESGDSSISYSSPFFLIVVGFWSSAVRINHRQLEYKFLSIRTGTRYVSLVAQFSSNNHDVVTCHSRTPSTLRTKRQRPINRTQYILHVARLETNNPPAIIL